MLSIEKVFSGLEFTNHKKNPQPATFEPKPGTDIPDLTRRKENTVVPVSIFFPEILYCVVIHAQQSEAIATPQH